MNDDELRAALARRAAGQLSADERNDVLRAARMSAAAAPARRSFAPRLASYLVAAVAVVVLAIISLPILLSPPGPARPTRSTGVSVLTTHQLVDLANSGWAAGNVVIADTTITSSDPVPSCIRGIACPRGQIIDGNTRLPVSIGFRDTGSTDGSPVAVEDPPGSFSNRWITSLNLPSGEQQSAFLVQDGSVEFLGPAETAPEGGPLQISDLPIGEEKTPTDNVYVVHGWWWAGLWPNCPAQPQSPPVQLDFYCTGFWLTQDRPSSTDTTTPPEDALLLAGGEYPAWSDQHSPGAPVGGTYVVRSAGCQITLDNRCPVWRMLGKLDDRTAPGPTPPPQASPPPATPQATIGSTLPIADAQTLADVIGDPNWVGKSVLADLPAGAIQHDPCSSPIGSAIVNACNRGTLDNVTGPHESVVVGVRNATAADGVQQDDGSGYRWVKPLAWPTDAGTYAFVVGQDSVEYLGPASLGPDDGPADVTSLLGNPSDLSDTVYVVSGWLTQTYAAPCPGPLQDQQTPRPNIWDYYCSGSWLTPSNEPSSPAGIIYGDGLHVQGGAYNDFASDPQPLPPGDEPGGYQPRQGVYLVRNAGCPELVTGTCPVWRMVGRLDLGSSPAPTSTPNVSPQGILIPTGTPPPNSSPQPCPAAVRNAYLVADDTYGVATRAADGSAAKVVWPYGYSAVADGGRVALLDEAGRVLAYTGDYVSIGGGDLPDGSFNGCGGVTVIGPDGSSAPNATVVPEGSAAAVQYVHLTDAISTARTAVNQPNPQLRSYAAGSFQSVSQILLGPSRLTELPDGLTWETMVWGAQFTSADLLTTVYLDLFTGQVLDVNNVSMPVQPQPVHKSDISFGDPTVNVADSTTLEISVYLNDTLAADIPSGNSTQINPYNFGPAPWTVRTTTSSGRQLTTGVLDPRNVWGASGDYPLESQSFGERAYLSCGQLTVWAGGFPSGPAPGPSYPPGDCDP